MNQYLINFAQKIGVDKAIAYSSGSRVVQGFTGVFSVFFITTFLTGVEQGFYYTFGSILALQVFFELGLTGIITQYVAHEASHLTLDAEFHYQGEYRFRSRLASLVRFCIKWYGLLSIIIVVFLVVAGFFFFGRYGSKNAGVSWQLPWLLLCFATGLNFFQSPFNSIFMGIGKVKEISKIGFYQQIILPVSIWVGLASGLKLYVIGIGYILSIILWQLFVWKMGLRKLIVNLWRTRITDRVSYMNEVFPYQWRIALSWVSGYFIFQLFNPVLFATEGAVVAGQMGMTLTALNAIQSFSFSWLNTKIPIYSQLIARNKIVELDLLFNKTLKQMTSVCLILCVLFFSLIWVLNVTQFSLGENLLADRFLPYLPLLLMILPVYIQQYVNSWATYLRCHKQEPFLWNSVVCGLVSCISTFTFGRLYGLYGVTVSYCVISILFFPWGYWIYKTKKCEWHGE